MPPPSRPPPEVCDFGLDDLLLETRDQAGLAFADATGTTSAFASGDFAVIAQTSTLQTRVAGSDTHVW